MEEQADQNTRTLGPLHHVSRADVPRLVKSLEAHGSDALSIQTVIETILDWWEKNDAYRCTILAPEGGEDQGVCALIMCQYERQRLLLFAPENETPRFIKCLEETTLIPWDSVTTVCRLIQRLRDPVDKLLEEKGYKLFLGSWNYFMVLSPDDALALEEPELPNNVSLRDLTEDDSSLVSHNWKFAHTDGIPLTKDGIRYNGGVGAVDKDGKLIGWVCWNRWGSVGQLFVFPSHRRLGIGRIVTIRLAKEIARKGRFVTAEVECDNEASLKLFQNLGFRCDFLQCYRGIRHAK